VGVESEVGEGAVGGRGIRVVRFRWEV
jgi:hypothetical protein